MPTSIFNIFKIGIGPSSSHTVGPMKAARSFIFTLKQKGLFHPSKLSHIKTELFGSLALTGGGHGTDKAILLGLMGETPETVPIATIKARLDLLKTTQRLNLFNEFEIPFIAKDHMIFHRTKRLAYHTNGMRFLAFHDSREVARQIFYSIGGGFIKSEEEVKAETCSPPSEKPIPYPFKTAADLLSVCASNKMTISQVIFENEKVSYPENVIHSKLQEIWSVMRQCVADGCKNDGLLPGSLKLKRRAPQLYQTLLKGEDASDPMNPMDWVNVYALAASEENAAGGRIVTAPTNGAAGIIPAVLHYYDKFYSKQYPNQIENFLLTAAAIGMIIKDNATISGAEGGCQAEVGSACSMAAAGLTAALGGSIEQIESAAEIGLEHNLGLTCDPVDGLVQIPCIERNTMGAIKAINASALALGGDGSHRITLDSVIKVMKETGSDMQTKYKETSEGGLALEVAELKMEQDKLEKKRKMGGDVC